MAPKIKGGCIMPADISRIGFANFFGVFSNPLVEMMRKELGFDTSLNLIYKDSEGQIHSLPGVGDFLNLYNPNTIKVTQIAAQSVVGVGVEGDNHLKVATALPLSFIVKATGIHERQVIVQYDKNNVTKNILPLPEFFSKLSSYADEFNVNTGVLTEWIKHEKIITQPERTELTNNAIFKVAFLDTSIVTTTFNYPATVEANKDDIAYRDYTYIGADNCLYIIKDKAIQELPLPFTILNARTAPVTIKYPNTYFLFERDDSLVMKTYRRVADMMEATSYEFIKQTENFAISGILRSAKVSSEQTVYENLIITETGKSVSGMMSNVYYDIIVSTTENCTNPTIEYNILDITDGLFSYIFRLIKDISNNSSGNGSGPAIIGGDSDVKKYVFSYTFVATTETSNFTIPPEIFSPLNGDTVMITYDNLVLDKDENYVINQSTNDVSLGFTMKLGETIDCLIFKYVNNDSSAAIIETLQTNINLNQVALSTHILATLNPHGATSESTPSTIISRDEDGCAKIATPLLSDHIANREYVDSKMLGFYTSTHVDNNYSVVIPTLTGDTPDGYGVCVKFDAASTGLATLTINGLTPYPIVDYYGNQISDIRAGLIAHVRFDINNGNFQLLGKGGDRTKELDLAKQVANLTAIVDVYDTVAGAQSVLYDNYDNTNDGSAGILDTFFAVASTSITAGSQSVSVDSLTNIAAGSEVTINDDTLYERIIVSSIDINNKLINFKTAISNNYNIGAHISRSHSIVVDNKLKSRQWLYNQSNMMSGGMDSGIHMVTTDSTATNRDRCHVTELSNKWLVAVVNSFSRMAVLLYISKDEGLSWQYLTCINTNITATQSLRVTSYNTEVTVLVSYDNHVYATTFDAAGIVPAQLTSLISIYSAYYGDNGYITCDKSNGTMYVVWSGKSTEYPTYVNIQFAKSTDRGQSWTKMDGTTGIDNITTYDTGASCVTPHIIINQNGVPVIIYIYARSLEVMAIKCKIWNGTVWADTQNNGNISVFDYTYIQSAPTMIIDHHNIIHATWSGSDSNSSSKKNVMYAYSSDGGYTWSSIQKLTNYSSMYGIVYDSLSVNDDDTLFILFERNYSTTKIGIFMISRSYGSTEWTKPTPLVSTYATAIARTHSQMTIPYCRTLPRYIYMAQSALNGFVFHGDYGFNTVTSSAMISDINYDVSGPGARKITKLSNGWIVVACYSPADSYIHFKILKDDHIWHTLCKYGAISGVVGKDFAVCSNGTIVYMVLGRATDYQLHGIMFDAATVEAGAVLTDSFTPISTQSGFSGVSITHDSTALHVVVAATNEVYSDSYNIMYTQSTDDCVTWKKVNGTIGYDNVTAINTIGDNYYSPTIILDDGVPNIISSHAMSGTYSICNWQYISSWSEHVIHSDTYLQEDACATIDSTGCIHVVWDGLDTVDSTYANVHYSKSSDGGATWSAQTKLTSGNTLCANTHATISVDNIDTVYVYYSGPNITANQSQIFETTYKDGSWAYKAIEIITPTVTAGQTTPQSVMIANSSYPDLIWNDLEMLTTRYRGLNDVIIKSDSLISNRFAKFGMDGRRYTILDNGWHIIIFNDGAMGHNYTAYIMVSKDGGNSWKQLCYIGGAGLANVAYNIGIDSIGNTVYIVFNSSNNLAGPIDTNFVKFDATTVSNINIYSEAIPIDTQSLFGYGCDVKVSENGTIYAVWSSANDTYPNSINIRYSKSIDNGVTWMTPEYVEDDYILNTSSASMDFPILSIKDNVPYIFSRLIDVDTQQYLRINKLTEAGFVHSNIYNFGSSINGIYNLTSVIDSTGKIFVAYHVIDSTQTKYNVYMSQSIDGGTTWADPLLMNNRADYGSYPTITCDKNDRVYIIYSEKNGTLSISDIVYRVFDGVSWSTQSIFIFGCYAPRMMTSPHVPEKFREFELFPPMMWYIQNGTGLRAAGLSTYKKQSNVQVEDNRYNITPPNSGVNSIVTWVSYEKDNNLSIDSKISMVGATDDESFIDMSDSTTSISSGINEIQSIYSNSESNSKATLRITVNRTNDSTHNKSITKLLGAID